MGWGMSFIFPGDAGISQTVYKIRDAVYYGVRTPRVRALAETIVSACVERDERQELDCLRKYVLDHYRYLRDPRGVDLIKSPEVVVDEIGRLSFFQGDCDDVTAFMSSLLMSIGFPVRLVVLEPVGKDSFKHVYLEAFMTKAQEWLAIDCTARNKELGWSAPNNRVRYYDL